MRPKHEINKKVGQRIREARKAYGITLAELGERVGISESNMQRYESGYIASVSIDMVGKIAKAMNISPAFLMGWNDEIIPLEYQIKTIEANKELDNNPYLAKLIENAKGLSNESIDKACDFLKFLRTQEKEGKG